MQASWPLVVPARLVAGAIHLNRARLLAQLKGRRDCELEIIIERKHATRSLAANAYYWSVVLKLLAEHTGNHPDELHEHFKRELLGRDIVLVDGNGEIFQDGRVGQSTTKLNANDFYEYVERIREVAARIGVVIPDPDVDWRRTRQEAHA